MAEEYKQGQNTGSSNGLTPDKIEVIRGYYRVNEVGRKSPKDVAEDLRRGGFKDVTPENVETVRDLILTERQGR